MPKQSTATYRDLSDELDAIMLQFQDTDLDVDQALTLYKEAEALIKKMQVRLETAENQIKKLSIDSK